MLLFTVVICYTGYVFSNKIDKVQIGHAVSFQITLNFCHNGIIITYVVSSCTINIIMRK